MLGAHGLSATADVLRVSLDDRNQRRRVAR